MRAVFSVLVFGFLFALSPFYAIVIFFHHYYLFLFVLSIRFCPLERFSAATGNGLKSWLMPVPTRSFQDDKGELKGLCGKK
jgi:hypothetical protein